MFEGTNLVLNSESAPSNISYTKLSLSYTKLSKLIIYLHAKFPLWSHAETSIVYTRLNS
jgi:hypothetical protein